MEFIGWVEILARPNRGFLVSSWKLGQELRHKRSVSEKTCLKEAAEVIPTDDLTTQLGTDVRVSVYLNLDLRQAKDLLKDRVKK